MRILDNVYFERKKPYMKGRSEDAESSNLSSPPAGINGRILGNQVAVTDPMVARYLYSTYNIGSLVGQRMNFINKRCFSQLSPPSDEPPGKDGLSIMEENDDDDSPHDDKTESTENNACSASKTAEEQSAMDGEDEAEAVDESTESDERKRWLESSRSGGWLFLSMAEALYLLDGFGAKSDCPPLPPFRFTVDDFMEADEFFKYLKRSTLTSRHCVERFINRYAVYRHFRRCGWVVRDGIFFGADYLLYQESVDRVHASAAVCIVETNAENDGSIPLINDLFLTALQRELSSCKKNLMIAEVRRSDADSCETYSQICQIRPKIALMDEWHWNRSRIADLDRK